MRIAPVRNVALFLDSVKWRCEVEARSIVRKRRNGYSLRRTIPAEAAIRRTPNTRLKVPETA